jgi:hypothetical protein
MTMKPMPLAQHAAAVLVTVTPWLVVSIVCRVAQRYARSVSQPLERPRSVIRLGWTTLVAAIAIGGGALVIPSPLWLWPAAGLVFVGLSVLALRALGEVDDLSKPSREVTASVRSASLAVRRAGQYLPWQWRFAVYAVGLAGSVAFVARVATPAADRRLVVPITMAAAAMVFLWLYEVWIQELVSSPATPEGQPSSTRERFIRGVFAMEAALVTGCLAAAHVLLDLNWQTSGVLGAFVSIGAGILGIVGCALALSSNLARRGYAPVAGEPIRR